MQNKTVTIALAGNPNCGKSVIFNALTGSRQRVGNWPGVTVEKKFGEFVQNNLTVRVVDLPGIYSLMNADENAIDVEIATQYLLSGEIDCLVNVVDASNLERNLYLTTQLLSLGLPCVLAVNMLDVAQARGLDIRLKKTKSVIKLSGSTINST